MEYKMKNLIFIFALLFVASQAWGAEEKCDEKPSWLPSYVVNGIPYICDSKTHKMVVDGEGIKSLKEDEKHKADLQHALVSRVLTDSEMEEVLNQGAYLFTKNMVPYMQKDVDEQYYKALQQQFRLRIIKDKERKRK